MCLCLPAGLMDVLQGEHLHTAVTVNAVICLVSTRVTYGSTTAFSCFQHSLSMRKESLLE